MKTSLLHARQAKDAGCANTAMFLIKLKQEFTRLSASLSPKVPLDVYLKGNGQNLFCKYILTKMHNFHYSPSVK